MKIRGKDKAIKQDIIYKKVQKISIDKWSNNIPMKNKKFEIYLLIDFEQSVYIYKFIWILFMIQNFIDFKYLNI